METSRAINIVRKVSCTTSAVVSIINSHELFTSPRLVVPTHLVNLSRFQKESVKYVWNLFGKRDKAFIRFFDWFFGQYPEERKCLEKMHKFTEKVIARVETGLSEVLKDLDDREHLDSILIVLARNHQGRGVPRESFEIFIGAFCKFIAEELDGDISEFDLEAWAITLRILMNSFGLYLC